MSAEGDEVGAGLSTVRYPPIWLDALPREEIPQIAYWLFQRDALGNDWDPVLPLAETSPPLRDAVKSVVGRVRSRLDCHNKRWKDVLEAVDDYVSLAEGQNRDKSVAQILRQRAWSKAHIRPRYDEGIEIDLDYGSRHSCLIYEEPLDRGVNSFLLVASSVEELSVNCGCGCSRRVGDEYCFVQRAAERGVVGATVQKLDVKCKNLNEEGLDGLLRSCNRLREIILYNVCQFTDAMVDKLGQVEGIHLEELERSDLSTVVKLARNVKSLRFRRWQEGRPQTLSGVDMQALSKCLKLTSLTAAVENGAEVAVGELPLTLRRLRLQWVNNDGPLRLHELKSRVIVRYAQRCTWLSVLHLSNVCIRGDDLVAILEWMGAQLQEFHGCLCHEDSTTEGFTAIVEQLVMSNPSVLTFNLSPVFYRRQVKEELTLHACRKADRLRAIFRVLCRRVPRLDTRSLAEAIKLVLEPIDDFKSK